MGGINACVRVRLPPPLSVAMLTSQTVKEGTGVDAAGAWAIWTSTHLLAIHKKVAAISGKEVQGVVDAVCLERLGTLFVSLACVCKQILVQAEPCHSDWHGQVHRARRWCFASME